MPINQKKFNAEAEQQKKIILFFDEDSEKNTKEGLKQLKEYFERKASYVKKL